MHGIVGQASIIIIACKASYCVVTPHNTLDTGMHVDVCYIDTNQAVSTYVFLRQVLYLRE